VGGGWGVGGGGGGGRGQVWGGDGEDTISADEHGRLQV